MDLADYVIKLVTVEGQSVPEVARAHGISRSWLYELLARHRAGGDEALKPGSRRPKTSPTRISEAMADQIVAMRKSLADQGADAGADTIRYHLLKAHRGGAGDEVPSVATIWRVLSRRGFIVAQPHKRPKSSWRRFEADLPNERWQSDMTHWALADRTGVEILNFIDDHSRLAIACRAFPTVKVTDVVETFYLGAGEFGLPASLLTDNGAIFTATSRRGTSVLQLELLALGIDQIFSRPYHPQTCGKVERFHQTLKRWLARQPPAAALAELQAQLDEFRTYYNQVRPHRAVARRTPAEAFAARTKAYPRRQGLVVPTDYRVRQDRVDSGGRVTLRYRSKLLHIGIGRAYAGQRVLLLVADRHVRILTVEGELVRELTIDPTRDYQPLG